MLKISSTSFHRSSEGLVKLTPQVVEQIKLLDMQQLKTVSMSECFFGDTSLTKHWRIEIALMAKKANNMDLLYSLNEAMLSSAFEHKSKSLYWLTIWLTNVIESESKIEFRLFWETIAYSNDLSMNMFLKSHLSNLKGIGSFIRSIYKSLYKPSLLKLLPDPNESTSIFYRAILIGALYPKKNLYLDNSCIETDDHMEMADYFFERGLLIPAHSGVSHEIDLLPSIEDSQSMWYGTYALSLTLAKGDMKAFKQAWKYSTTEAKEKVKSSMALIQVSPDADWFSLSPSYHSRAMEAMMIIHEGDLPNKLTTNLMKDILRVYRLHGRDNYRRLRKAICSNENATERLPFAEIPKAKLENGLIALAKDLLPYFINKKLTYLDLIAVVGQYELLDTQDLSEIFNKETRNQSINLAIRWRDCRLLAMLAPSDNELLSLSKFDYILVGFLMKNQNEEDVSISCLEAIDRKRPPDPDDLQYYSRLLNYFGEFSDLIRVNNPFIKSIVMKSMGS